MPAKEEGDRQLAAAQANIEQEANRARESLREQVAALPWPARRKSCAAKSTRKRTLTSWAS